MSSGPKQMFSIAKQLNFFFTPMFFAGSATSFAQRPAKAVSLVQSIHIGSKYSGQKLLINTNTQYQYYNESKSSNQS